MSLFSDISAFCVISGVVGAAIISLDIRRHRPSMRIMEAVWPLTILWAHWLGVWAYFSFGRHKTTTSSEIHSSMTPIGMKKDMKMKMDMGSSRPMWQRITLSVLHCGAGCTLADILGEWITFFVPITLAGSWVAAQWTLDYLLALVIGIYFQYAAIQPMEHLSWSKAIYKAFKVDFFSLTSWQIGMYGWMAIAIWGIYDGTLPAKTSFEFWFLIQIAMLFGFISAYPTNKLLIKLGIKHAM